MTLEDKIKNVHATVSKVREYPEGDVHKRVQWRYFEEMYLLLKDANGQLELEDANKRKEISDTLWDKLADVIAVEYLNLSDELLKELKNHKDALEVSPYEDLIARYVGITRDEFYETFFKGRKKFDTSTAMQVQRQASEQHLQQVLGAYVTKNIKSKDDAQAVTKYFKEAKKKLPDAFKDVDIEDYVEPQQARQAIFRHADRARGYDPQHLYEGH